MRIAGFGKEMLFTFVGWPLAAAVSIGVFVRLLVTGRWTNSRLELVGGPHGASLDHLLRFVLFDPVVAGVVAALAVMAATLLITCRDALGETVESWQVTLIVCACYSFTAFVVGCI